MKKYLFKIKWYIILTVILNVLEVLITSIILVFPGYMIDHYIKGIHTIWKLILCYIGLFAFYLLSAYISNRVADYRRIKFEKEIKKDFFNAVIEKNYEEYHKYDVGEYLSMQANDLTEMCQNYLSPLLAVFRAIIMIFIFGCSLIYFVDTSIALVIVLFSVIAVFIPSLTAKQLSERNGCYLNSVGTYTTKSKILLEAYDILDQKSVKTIEQIHEAELDDVLSQNMKFRTLNSFAMVLNGGVVEFVSIVAFAVTAILLLNGKITIGMATTAFLYSGKFIEPLGELNLNIGRIRSVHEIQNKLSNIMNQRAVLKKCGVSSLNRIEVQNVRKRFKSREILIPDMEFTFQNKYLICGDNGVGKSVLFRMIMGFYKPDEGKILYDSREGIDTNPIINYVPQQPIIFTSSYLDNVTLYGAYEEDKLPFYESFFPEEIINHIKIGTNHQNLSGGEKQVIALLRGLCSNKPILLLDEPFSAMNQATIDKFMENLDKIECMLLIIAHNVEKHQGKFDKLYYISLKNSNTTTKGEYQ